MKSIVALFALVALVGCQSPASSSKTSVHGPVGIVTTFAGTGTDTSFDYPNGLAVDSSGNVYVADSLNNVIRKITPAGVVSTFAGSGTAGSADGTGTAASFDSPEDVAVDSSENLYVADMNNNMIRKITPDGVVTTLAGSTTAGSTNSDRSASVVIHGSGPLYSSGVGTGPSFNKPAGVGVDLSGNVYVADQGNNMIRKITPDGVVTTLAGSTTRGFANGTGTAASFHFPTSVAVDASGNVYVTDTENYRIRKITADGVVTTFAGSGTQGFADGNGAAAMFAYPMGLTFDSWGNLYVGDYSNNRIRKISQDGVVTTLAGSATAGYADGTGSDALFAGPAGVAFGSGNLYVSDSDNQVIRKIQ